MAKPLHVSSLWVIWSQPLFYDKWTLTVSSKHFDSSHLSWFHTSLSTNKAATAKVHPFLKRSFRDGVAAHCNRGPTALYSGEVERFHLKSPAWKNKHMVQQLHMHVVFVTLQHKPPHTRMFQTEFGTGGFWIMTIILHISVMIQHQVHTGHVAHFYLSSYLFECDVVCSQNPGHIPQPGHILCLDVNLTVSSVLKSLHYKQEWNLK